MSATMQCEFKSRPAKRFFHRCQTCRSEWPTSLEYCRRCATWLGSTYDSEDILWYVPVNGFLTSNKRNIPEGVYETTMLTIAAYDSFYASSSRCPELLLEAARQMVASGGLLTRSPGGHLTGCFINRNLADAAILSVQCALVVQNECEKNGLNMFAGINTGPVLIGTQIVEGHERSQCVVSGNVVARSEAVAFSLYPRMVILSPATFKLVTSRYECYGTGPLALWGTYPQTPKIIYVVAGSKKVTNWRHRLDDDSVPLIGRRGELDLLCHYWERTVSKKTVTGPLIHLVGEPGSGKSKLLQAFLAKASPGVKHMIAVKLAGANYGGRPGLMLEEFANACAAEGILSATRTCEVPGQGSETPQSSIPKSHHARVRLVSQLLTELESRGPALIVIDDVHWTDRASLRALGEAFSHLPPGVMVIASYRPSGFALAELLPQPMTRRIVMQPLDEAEARQVSKLHMKDGKRLSGTAWRELWKKSRGNPLYVEEATKLLVSRSETSPREAPQDAAQSRRALPGSRSGLLSARIREWADRELYELRRTVTFRWDTSPRGRLAGLETQVNDWLDRLETQNYLERIELAECLDELEHFQNRVVEICLVGGLSRPLTTRLGEALSRLYEGSYGDYCRYLRRTSRLEKNRLRAGNQALRVGDRALRAGKLRHATRFFRIAEDTLPSDYPLERDLLEKAGDANLMLGRSVEAARLYERLLSESRITDPHDDVAHKLLAARILTGEKQILAFFENGDDRCPWHLFLRGVATLLAGESPTSLKCAEKAEQTSSDWVIGAGSCLIQALATLSNGNREDALLFCKRAAEKMESGGASLLSLGLHWMLSQVKEGAPSNRHVSMSKAIARKLGMRSAHGYRIPHLLTTDRRIHQRPE